MTKVKAIIQNGCQSLRDKGALYIVTGSFLTKFVSLFSSIFLVRILSKSDYGILGYYENFLGYFLIFRGFGLVNGIRRQVILAADTNAKYSYVKHCLTRGFAYSALLVVAALCFDRVFPYADAYASFHKVFWLLALSIPFSFLKEASVELPRAMFDNRTFAVISVVTATVFVVVRVLGACLGGLYGSVTARAGIELLLAVFCVALMKRKYFPDAKANELEPAQKRDLMGYSLQMMVTNGFWLLFSLNSAFLIGTLCNDELLLADFKVASVIPNNLSILTSAIGMFIGPYFVKYENEKRFDLIRSYYKKTMAVSVALFGVCSLAFGLFGKWVVLLLYGEKYLSVLPVMNVLLLAAFFNNAIRYTTANILSYMGQPKHNMIIAGVGIVLQILLSLYAIPRFGTVGAAWTSVIVYLVMSVYIVLIFYRNYYANKQTES